MLKSKGFYIATALVISVLLWIYVVTVVNPEDTVEISDIPVTFSGQEVLREDYGLIISEGQNATVSLKLSGKRSELSQLNPSNITATVDVSNVRRARSYNGIPKVSYPANVNESEVSIVERTPGTISYTVERLATNPVEVVGVFEGNPAEGYEVGTMTFDHDTVEVSGTEEVINAISYARVTVRRTNLDTTVTEVLDYELINKDGSQTDLDDVITDVQQIEVTLPVSKLKAVLLSVNLLSGGGATEANAFVDIKPDKITLSGDASIIDDVNQLTLGSIDLSEVDGKAGFEFPIRIPNSAKNISGEETAVVTVELRGLMTRKVRAGSIDFSNVPDGLEPDSLTTQLMVSLRGPAEQMQQVTSDNIRAVADLTKYTKTGTFEVPVTVYIDGFPEVGVTEEKTLTVNLRTEGEQEPEPQNDPDDAETTESVESADSAETA